MKNLRLTQSNRRLGSVRLGLTMGLALFFLVALLWGLRGATPAQAIPGTLYVDGATGSDTTDCTTPVSPCATIGYALTQAANSDEIRVAESTYMETLGINITVTLKGGYEATGWTRDIAAHPTIVDANGADNQVITISPDTNVTVEGFTVQGANHTSDVGGGFFIVGATVVISDTVVRNNSAQSGGGIYAENATNVSLINSTFTANAAAGGASGVAGGVLGRMLIQNTVFAENTGDCVLEFESGQPFEITGGQVVSNTVSGWRTIALNSAGTISGTAILSNTSIGIGVQPNGIVSAQNLTLRGNTGGIANSGVLTITNSVIENNSGSGSAAVSSENWPETNRLVMDGCTIRGNSTANIVRITTGYAEIRNTKIVDHVVADPHVHIVSIGEAGTTPTVEMINVLLADNESEQPVVDVTSETGSAMLMNVTVTGNQVPENPILHAHGAMTLTNTIVWGNTTDADMLGGPGALSVSYSDIEGEWPGAGNINANPWFVDPSGGDYHLQAWSPCIDSATAASAPDHDYEGDTRPQNAGYDMGADEFVGTPIQNEGTRYVTTSGSNAGPNLCLDPATPCQTVGHGLDMANAGESILVAQGTYTENLSTSKPVTLTGGYEATGWTRDLTQYETLIDGSGTPLVPGDWDGDQVRYPSVINDGGTYKMWYVGTDLYSVGRIGYATSPDGVNWTKHAANPVLDVGANSEWDSQELEAPFVIKEGPTSYKMWYTGRGPDDSWRIGYATSTDGANWTKYAGNPVLDLDTDTWNNVSVHGPSILYEDSLYKMWLHTVGDDGSGPTPHTAYATSPNGITWTLAITNPLFSRDPAHYWESDWVWGPSVLHIGSNYQIWYSSAGGGEGHTGYATAPDETTWTKYNGGADPVLSGAGGEWDEGTAYDPFVLYASGTYTMYYDNSASIGVATSTNGITWTKSLSNPVLTSGTPGQWGDPVVRFAQGGDGAVLDGFTITGGNAEAGGGVDASGASITIRNCLIRDNFAHGMPHYYGGGGVSGGPLGLTILDSRIINNQVNGGAGGVRGDSVAMVNTLVADNHGDAGIHVNGSLALMNTTVANNDGGVIFNPQVSATLTVTNSIIYFNGWSISEEGGGNTQVTYSDIEGGWPGAGNIAADPLFVNSSGGDYHLQGNSPAIDAGTPAGAPPADLDGTPRDAAPDMGVYEYTRFDHDVAIVNVLPSGGVAVNVAFPIRATLYNIGNLAENNVPVICDIKHDGATVYQQTTNSNEIQPLTWQVLEFPTYTPADQGTYTLTCQSTLTSDERSSNNVYSRTLSALPEIADVWTKDNPDDNGDVPSGLDNWYESPDIWVRNNADGGLIHQGPIAGATNTVYLRLRNRGTVPISGTVDVYWIEPSLGVRCGDWAFINTITFSNLLPGEVRIVSTPWVPTRTGHTCLQDVVDSPQDPYNRGLECAPQWVPWDNNVEWRNVDIIENPAGGPLGPLDVQQTEVQLVNVYNLPRDVDVIVERITFPTTGTITVQLPSDLFDRWLAYGGHWSAGIKVLTTTKAISITGAVSATIGAIPMDAAEKAKVELIFDGPAGLEFEITIRERIDGLTVGGTTYQWVIPDTTPPNVVDTFPSNGATDVGLDEPIVITFDEEIGPLNLDLALAPDPGGWRMVWNEAGTVVTATHAGFARGTIYTATVTANDAAANPMAAPLTWPFATERYRIYLPIVIRNS